MLSNNVDPRDGLLSVLNPKNSTVGGDYAWLESDIRVPFVPFKYKWNMSFMSYWEVGDTFVLPDTRLEALPYFVTERFPTLPRLANKTYRSIGYICVRVHNIYTKRDSIKRYYAFEPMVSYEECSHELKRKEGQLIAEYKLTGKIIQSENELAKRIRSLTYEGEMFDAVLGRRLLVEDVRQIEIPCKEDGCIVKSNYARVIDFKIVKKDLY